MESQNGSIDENSAYVCGPSIFPMDASNNQQLQSVQYGLTDDEENPRPTCQKDNSDFMPPSEDNCKTLHTPTLETSFRCYGVPRYYGVHVHLLVVPQLDVVSHGVVLSSMISSESETDQNDELLENHSAVEVDKPNKNTKLRTGLCYQLT